MRGLFAARLSHLSLRAGPDEEAKTNGGGRRRRPLALLSWSGGKDSAMTLHENTRSGSYEVVALLTTVTRDFDRVSMHGVRRTLLEMQGEAVGLPIEEVWIGKNASNAEYQSQMKAVLEKCNLAG